MTTVESDVVAVIFAGLQQLPVPNQLVIIAVANAVVWVGLFQLLLWLLNRRVKSVEDRISQLETSIQADNNLSER